MIPQTFTMALDTPLTHVYDLDGKTILKTLPEGILAMLRAKKPSEAAAQVFTADELLALNACLLNFSLKPSPEHLDDVIVAISTFKANLKNLEGLLNSCSTHVLKAVNASLPGIMILDKSHKEELGIGICKDTLAVEPLVSLGSDAKHAAVLQFWTTLYTLPNGICARNLEVYLGFHGCEYQKMLEDVIEKLAEGEDISGLSTARSRMTDNPIPQDVYGKEVIFPLSANAAQGDKYVVITPVPSVTTLKEMKDRYVERRSVFFDEKRAYDTELKQFNQAQKVFHKLKNKEGIEPPTMVLTEPFYPLPSMKLVKLVASNPQNLGGELMKMGGQPIAFNAYIQPLPYSKTEIGSQKRVQRLRAQYHTLIQVGPALESLLFREPKTAKLRLRWIEELHDALIKMTQDLVSVRRDGLPIKPESVRLKDGPERRYIMREMAGDKLKRSLNSTDLSEITTHVVNALTYRLVKRGHPMGMPPDVKTAVVEALTHFFRKVS